MGKIGVFDSGFGGLSILKEIAKVLPQYDYVYLGDNVRAPYGSHTQDVILDDTKRGIDFLFDHGAELVVLACNTASSEALRKIQQEYLPTHYPDKKVLGVIIPACEEAITKTRNKKIGVLGTEATISSHAFMRELKKLDRDVEVYEIAAPLLVPLVESGEEESDKARELTREYMSKLPTDIDTLILGCTHYGFFESEISKMAGDKEVIAEGSVVAEKLQEYLSRHMDAVLILSQNRGREFYTTGDIDVFNRLGTRFFGGEVRAEKVDLS